MTLVAIQLYDSVFKTVPQKVLGKVAKVFTNLRTNFHPLDGGRY